MNQLRRKKRKKQMIKIDPPIKSKNISISRNCNKDEKYISLKEKDHVNESINTFNDNKKMLMLLKIMIHIKLIIKLIWLKLQRKK
jgi:hypothetical protein